MFDDTTPQTPSLFEQMVSSTDQVQAALAKEWAKTPALGYLFDTLGGMVYHAAQKLIDMKENGAARNAVDEATIISCSRLFNACFSGYALLTRGLVVDSFVLLRSAYELTTQIEAFFQRPELAERWLAGKKIAPREVRQVSPLALSSKELYDRLSGIAHPNLAASLYHVLPITAGTALVYGGSYQPKAAGQLACQLLWAELTFLDMFYRRNSHRLAKFNVL
jgi:hypothetical protein